MIVPEAAIAVTSHLTERKALGCQLFKITAVERDSSLYSVAEVAVAETVSLA